MREGPRASLQDPYPQISVGLHSANRWKPQAASEMEVLQSGGRVAFQLFHFWEHALLESALRVHEGTPGSPLGRGSGAQEGGYTASEPLTCERTPLLPIHIHINTTFFSPPFMQKVRLTHREAWLYWWINKCTSQMHSGDKAFHSFAFLSFFFWSCSLTLHLSLYWHMGGYAWIPKVPVSCSGDVVET